MEYYKFVKPHPKTHFAFVMVGSLATMKLLLTKGLPLHGVFLHNAKLEMPYAQSVHLHCTLALFEH